MKDFIILIVRQPALLTLVILVIFQTYYQNQTLRTGHAGTLFFLVPLFSTKTLTSFNGSTKAF